MFFERQDSGTKKMNVKEQFVHYIHDTNTLGSGKADSYVRAIEYANRMLKDNGEMYGDIGDIYEIDDIELLKELHQFFLTEASKGMNSKLLKSGIAHSYLDKHFCSAALKALIGYRLKEIRDAQIYRAVKTGNASLVQMAFDMPIDGTQYYLAGNVREGSDAAVAQIEEVKFVQNSKAFREIVFDNFNHACCVSGLDVEDVLMVCRIDPGIADFAPDNALCMAATYARAFNNNLITFDEDKRLVLSPSLSGHMQNDAYRHIFKAYEGVRMNGPALIRLSEASLRKHREALVS